MIGIVSVSLNRLPVAKTGRLGSFCAKKAAKAASRNAKFDADSPSRNDVASRNGAMADKAGLETIGSLLLLITLFVIGAGAFAVHHQHAADLSQDGAGYGVHQCQSRPARSVCAAVP